MQSATLHVVNVDWSSSFAHALTWTLVHSLWVGASVALCLYGFLRLVDARRARWRYAASRSALFSVPLVALWTLTRELSADGSEVWSSQFMSAAEGEWASTAMSGSLGMLLAWADGLRARIAIELAPLEQALAISWLSLAVLALARFAGGWALLELGASRELRRAAPCHQARAARLARRIGLCRRVGVYWSERAEVPMVVGAFRPKIVIPTPLADELERGALDLVLLHELAHVRRGDGVARTIEAVLQAVFVFHPILPWIAARVAREREHCCDDIALEAGGDRLGYLRSLAALETSRAACAARPRRWWSPAGAPPLALHATDGPLLERIRRMTALAPRVPRSRLAAACAILSVGSAGLAIGALPTHDAPLAAPQAGILRATPADVGHEFDLEWTRAVPGLEVAALARAHGARMIVLARDPDGGGANGAGPVELFVEGEFLRELPFDTDELEPDGAARLIRIRAIKSSR